MNALTTTISLPVMWRAVKPIISPSSRIDFFITVRLDGEDLVRRHHPAHGAYDESLSVDEASVVLDQIDAQPQPAHSFDTLTRFYPLGADIGDGEASFDIALTRDRAFRTTVERILAGKVKTLWLGYRVHHVEVDDTARTPIWRIARWEPVDVSTATADIGAWPAVITHSSPIKLEA